MTIGEKALETFLANEKWKEYYEMAPSDACRKAIEGEFVRSLNRMYSMAYDRDRLEAARTRERERSPGKSRKWAEKCRGKIIDLWNHLS